MAPVLYLFLWFLFIILSGLILIYVFVMEMPSLKLVYNTLGRDLRSIRIYLQTYFFVKKCHLQNQTLIDLFHKNVVKHQNEVCFIFEDEEWTFKQVNDLSNKIANHFRLQGYTKGDEVALIMENCPDYVCIWLGLAKIGVVTALINTNLRKESLAHSLNIIDMKACIFGLTLAEPLKSALPFLHKIDTADFYCYARNSENGLNTLFPSKSLNILLEDAPITSLDHIKYKINFDDKLLYIYTSGTTGLPKAAIIRHSRFIWISIAGHFVSQPDTPQVFYNPLPMYHSSGGIIFLGAVLICGGKMVLRKKFSASNFWKEIVKHKVTIFQYIGEICRYLLNQPKVPEETQHSVRMCFGNGMKSHIWKKFQERFKIKLVMEMYGSTEGNANLVNLFGKVGAVGFLSRIFTCLYPLYLIKINPETGEIMRDENGFCIRCKPGEPGEIVGKVCNNPVNSFDGYVNAVDTQKKIIRDCFQKGDIAFLSGDIMIMDEDGYIYFLDRTGDTFRWKGENVSTTEVEDIVSKSLNSCSCVVYGVSIPGTEGRAGMVAIQMDLKSIDLDNFYKIITDKLPKYAVPMFIRICSNIEATGTYKLRKVTYQNQGFNPAEISDPLYILDFKKKTYIPLTEEIYSDIIYGKMKL